MMSNRFFLPFEDITPLILAAHRDNYGEGNERLKLFIVKRTKVKELLTNEISSFLQR